MKNFCVQGLQIMKKELLLDTAEGLILVISLAILFYDSLAAAPFLSPLIWLWHRECVLTRRQRRDEQFRKQFREWILLLASSLSVGYSVENAFGQSLKELRLMFPKGGIMVDELQDMLANLENNQRPEMLLEEFADRHPYEEVRSFVEVFQTARISGGSLNAVIRNTAAQMAEIMDTRREIMTLLSAKVYEQKIMTVMPAAILLYIRVCSPEFLNGLYRNPAGICVMTVCLGIWLAAYLIGKRMVQIEI